MPPSMSILLNGLNIVTVLTDSGTYTVRPRCIRVHPCNPGIVNRGTIHILGWIILCCGRAAPVHHTLFRSTLGLYLLHARSTAPSPQLWQPKMSTDVAKCPLESKTVPSWEALKTELDVRVLKSAYVKGSTKK